VQGVGGGVEDEGCRGQENNSVLESDFRWNDKIDGLSIFCETGKIQGRETFIHLRRA
jgi:hypothetical protein